MLVVLRASGHYVVVLVPACVLCACLGSVSVIFVDLLELGSEGSRHSETRAFYIVPKGTQ